MPDAPASPPAGRLATPRWLDARLVLGVLLVLVSVVVGARVLAAADRTQLVWSAARDLPAGTALAEDDLRPQEVRLLDAGSSYLAAGDEAPVGYVLERAVARGELVPRGAVVEPGPDADLRLVSVPVQPGRFPSDLARGSLVDVWVTPDADLTATATAPAPAAPEDGAAPEGEAAAGAAPAGTASRLVLREVPVHAPPDRGGALSAGTTEQAVVLAVPPDDVAELVAAMSGGRVDLVRVPTRAEARGAVRAAG